jgi:hypothetical protein
MEKSFRPEDLGLNSQPIEIGGRLAPPPLSHHPACLLGTGRFLAASFLQSKIDGFGGNQAVCSPLARPGGCADSATLSARRRSFGRCPRCLCWRTPSPGLPRGWPPRPPSPLTLAPRRVSLPPPTTLAPPPARQFRLRPRCPYRGQPPPLPSKLSWSCAGRRRLVWHSLSLRFPVPLFLAACRA